MSVPNLMADEVLARLEKTSSGWRALIAQNPQVLDLPCDIAGTQTVGGSTGESIIAPRASV